MKNTVIILHNRIGLHPTTDETDVLDQAELVRKALVSMGYECHLMDVGENLYADLLEVRERNPRFVFNLVETVFGHTVLLHTVPSVLSAWHIPYSGVSHEALFLTTSKPLAKQIMSVHGINTPAWYNPQQALLHLNPSSKYILKPSSEEGSVKLDRDSVFRGDDPLAPARLSGCDPNEFFVEEYIEGREFNISVTGVPGRYTVYPIPEMIFDNFPPDMEHILGYKAKWEEDSFDYTHTFRRFDTLRNEPELAQRLEEIVLQCGRVFGLTGYFRVDFRVTDQNIPMVLEINGNPCIAPDSGFIAAGKHAGYSETEMIQQIISCIETK
ncbi:MAG: ATP-grasp domain-containing protein [Bacteroidales bacterium]|jgi:D-alanine-D-alanine ligase|nr:ATP-grasp domain-containing protein [Bacteroidales bacterium]MDD4258142.1 ATP-grasp domain-containing protein [Bacteroidales bacterium]